ncbi:hypothetical protein SK128_012126, partial [Halocaridina rubra]
MTEGSVKGLLEEEYVRVLETYSYQRQGHTYSMEKGELLMLLKRSSDLWWQVIRDRERRPFFAPAHLLKSEKPSTEHMKEILEQSQPPKKTSGVSSSKENVPISKSLGLPLSQNTVPLPPASEIPSPSNPLASHSYLTMIETNRIPLERTDLYPTRSMSTSSFKSENPNVPARGLLPRSGSNELGSPASYSRGFAPQVSHESSSSHTSKSSLNDGSRCSTESLSHPHGKKHHVIKAASHDELSSGDHCRSSLNISQPRAASSEELDGRYSSRDYLFRSNQLSYRNRSNSVDFKIIQKDLNFSEMKQGSLDKSHKKMIFKEPGHRRRSWAVEELRTHDSYRPSLKKGEIQDTSIVLDVPPKLPPKQKKHKNNDYFGSNSENIGRLEGPIDIKVQEAKSNRPSLPSTTPNVKRLSLDCDRGIARVSEELVESQLKSFSGHRDLNELKDVPVALPRKTLPQNLSSFDGRLDQRYQMGPSSITCDNLNKDSNSNEIKRERRENDPEHGSFKEKIHFVESDGGQNYIRSGSLGRPPGTPDLLRKLEKESDVSKNLYAPQNSTKCRVYPNPTIKSDGKRSEDIREKEEKEKECRSPPRETPTPDSSRGGRNASHFPPSPKCSPKRELYDNWGEYFDELSGRLFYYNQRTGEKRWKPPRKDMPSFALPEVPPHSKAEHCDFGVDPQPRSPPPDYPASPKSSHRIWSHNYPDGGVPPSSSRSSTLSFSMNRSSHHHPMATSHTLPAFTPSFSHKNPSFDPQKGHVFTPLSFPPVPPASAKPPHIPATPTSPINPEFPEFSEVEKNSSLLHVLYNISPPKGWDRNYDAYTQRVYFLDLVTGERWLPTTTEDGKIYYYEESGSKSQWKLPEHVEYSDSSDGKAMQNRSTSPNESLRISLLQENMSDFSNNIVKEGFLHRTFLMREGKKCRKNWTQSYVRYIKGQWNSGSSGLLYFTKSNKDEDK